MSKQLTAQDLKSLGITTKNQLDLFQQVNNKLRLDEGLEPLIYTADLPAENVSQDVQNYIKENVNPEYVITPGESVPDVVQNNKSLIRDEDITNYINSKL